MLILCLNVKRIEICVGDRMEEATIYDHYPEKVVEFKNVEANNTFWKIIEEHGRLLTEGEIELRKYSYEFQRYMIDLAIKNGAKLVIILWQNEKKAGILALDENCSFVKALPDDVGLYLAFKYLREAQN